MWGKRVDQDAAGRPSSLGSRGRSALHLDIHVPSCHHQNVLNNEYLVSSLCNYCFLEKVLAFSRLGSCPSSIVRRHLVLLRACRWWSALLVVYRWTWRSQSSRMSLLRYTRTLTMSDCPILASINTRSPATSDRPAYTFSGITVTELWETEKISTRLQWLRAFRLLNRPVLFAALARKHNTRAGSSRIGTKKIFRDTKLRKWVHSERPLRARFKQELAWERAKRREPVTPAGRRAGAATARLASLFWYSAVYMSETEWTLLTSGNSWPFDGFRTPLTFGQTRYFQRAGGRHVLARGRPPTGDIEAHRSVCTWSTNGIAQRTSLVDAISTAASCRWLLDA